MGRRRGTNRAQRPGARGSARGRGLNSVASASGTGTRRSVRQLARQISNDNPGNPAIGNVAEALQNARQNARQVQAEVHQPPVENEQQNRQQPDHIHAEQDVLDLHPNEDDRVVVDGPVGVAAAAAAAPVVGRGPVNVNIVDNNNTNGKCTNCTSSNHVNDNQDSANAISIVPHLLATSSSSNTEHNIPNSLVSVCNPLGSELPQALREKIIKGEFVDFGLILEKCELKSDDAKGVALTVNNEGKLVWENKPKRQIFSIHGWTTAFLTYASVFLEAHPEQGQALLKYCHLIRTSQTRFGNWGWKNYDTQFRYRKARNPERSWASIDSELWSLYMGASSQGVFSEFFPLP